MVSAEKRQLEFADRLRQFRSSSGFGTGKDFAEHIGWQASKVSRIENGRTLPSDADVAEWLRAVKVSESEADSVRDELREIRLARDRWRRQLREGHADRQRREAEAEQEATRLVSVEFFVVPGLAQAADYARHLFVMAARLHETPSDTEAAVAERIRRQAVLYDSTKTVEILVGESALRYPICPAPIMRAQVDRLLGLLDLRHVRLGIVPLDTELPTITMHGYAILDDEVTVEINHTELRITDVDDVELYERITADLWRIALEGDEARAMLRKGYRA
ncbi:helix-turn-helix domain-containing protein [Actinokineospora xionganensis]|uniref:Helix-turn-helix transcriptional regulator n=1 Tax=Actinokineospora xionganensis TaxID=2684470 RepID=A0ABR7LCM3_9PSEU|nr:helix-turn-helix transcriptional regulator [Actinokineospora xionganensis]MBC6450312.1 helix-turn-helix transcriptional regulator [Actinokineospora xionganensis]